MKHKSGLVVYTLVTKMSRILKWISLILVAIGTTVMSGMLLWSYRLDADFSASYACCTQQAGADFHKWFWAKFFVGVGLALTGCLVLSVVLPIKTAVKAGSVVLCLCVLGSFLTVRNTNIDMEGWTGASALTLACVVFASGAALLVIGGCRFAWAKLRSHV